MIEQRSVCQQGDAQGTQGGSGGDREHDDDLIAHGVDGTGSGQNLTGHHPRQANHSHYHHAVHYRNGCRAQAVLNQVMGGFPAGGS